MSERGSSSPSLPPSGSHQFSSAMDGAAEPLIGTAAAYIGDVRIDVGVGRIWTLLEKSRRRHDLPALAVAALRHILGNPGLLHRVPAVGRKAFNGYDAGAIDGANRHRA